MTAPNKPELTIERLREFLKDDKHQYGTAQTKLCFAMIKRMYYRCTDYDLGSIKVCSVRCMVVDGNHRFIAYSLAGMKFDVVSYTSSPCDILQEYSQVIVDEDDWDDNHDNTRKYCANDYIGSNWIKR